MADAAEHIPYIEKVGRETDRTEDRKLAKFMAVDLPDIEETATFILMTEPALARILLAASEAPTGWRVSSWLIDTPEIAELRKCGFVEAAGSKQTADSVARGRGFHLSAFGLKVRRHMMRIKPQ